MKANFETRTLYHADNLTVLRGMNSETVDLIATDPPFNKSRDFHATPNSLAAGAKFTDRWNWERDVHQEWVDAIKDDHPGVHWAIESAKVTYGQDMAAFLCWLGVRMIECHRVLKPTGSLYLHIDHTAHAYTKMLLDGIFGKKNFRNEIVWDYKKWTNAGKQFQRNHDTLLAYTKSESRTFHRQFEDDKPSHKAKGYHSNTVGKDNSVRQLLIYDASTAEAQVKIKEYEAGAYDKIVYVEGNQGTPIGDVWPIPHLKGKERTGYPTQKPLALYERIIKASSNEGDMVLDPFCGCATTPVAAERLNRQWVGIDVWDGAYDVVVKRLNDSRQLLRDATVPVAYSQTAPTRTDGQTQSTPDLRLTPQIALAAWQKLTHADMKQILCGAQRSSNGLVVCVGCGRQLEPEFMDLDHVRPKSEQGANTLDNRILLCHPCNGYKGNNYTLNGLMRLNRTKGWMKDDDAAKLAFINVTSVTRRVIADIAFAKKFGVTV